MINNSSCDRWDRLENKSLDRQFVREIVQGLSCSPFEGKAVLGAVYRVFGHYFETSTSLKPGQVRMQVLATEARAGQSIADSPQVMVVLTDLPPKNRSTVCGILWTEIKGGRT